MSAISGHIPDIDFITFCSEHNRSFFARVSPWTKALALVAIVLLITVVQSLPLLVALYAAVLAAYAAAGLPVRRLFAWYLLPLFFVFSLVVLMIWNVPGNELFSVGAPGFKATMTDNGLLMLARLLLKALISVSFSLFFLMTTKYNHFSTMIYRVFPSPIDQVFLMSYRFIFLTLKMVDSMVKALHSRGSGLISSAVRQSRLFAEVFALVFIRSYDRADRVSKAMESRGFSGKYIAATEVPPMRIPDYVFVAASFGLSGLAVLRGW
ncbi:MAG: Energy-coupling factor transporter transmembrane protein EcfT [Methanocella sp. PtaU1.Bin125]|nr:MAG: Energy-coupling factor transporter transmembrane protein EcfT [Methanocella sp. PtaU1.Bin125]